jgi:hypothetical protein
LYGRATINLFQLGTFERVRSAQVSHAPKEDRTERDMQSRTVPGLLAFCDYVNETGYQEANAWKPAVQSFFQTVEPQSWETINLDSVKFDDYIRVFVALAGVDVGTAALYGRRVKNAMDAQRRYIKKGKLPASRRGGLYGPLPDLFGVL